MNRTAPISGELLRLKSEIYTYAKGYGLDFPEVIFEICDYDTINILAAQGGFPTRYPHWRFGMDYDQMSKQYSYGLQKIYEMVINTDPCYAYLLNVNPTVDQKIVMAHVYGHADFFKNNYWFKNTNKKMMDVMANHTTKVRRYMERYGVEKVEAFIDTVLSLDNLLDVNLLYQDDVGRKRKVEKDKFIEPDQYDDDDRVQALQTFLRSKKKAEEKAVEEENKNNPKAKDDLEIIREPEGLPTRDIMGFLMEYAPIKEWEADLIGILREEAYYFLPQRITKIMNEGWASYWHSTIMTQKAMKASEIIDFSDHHSSVMAMSPQRINPYKIGIELFRDIEYRWNKGMFGKEYLECTNMQVKENWDKELGLGREKIFEVRTTHNDITFIDEFFTEEFCQRQNLFTYKYNSRTGRNEIETREFEEIKKKLLLSLTNFGSPLIEIESSNYENKGELLLRHVHQGVDLDLATATDTMRNLYAVWKRPINLATHYDDKEVKFLFDGEELKTLG
ncbi:MAG: SpoVR family protein [Epsilonproteobacteria bacterium]|nr:MAG: SpoVR family protein [Campylobacterota bacterium]RLA67123.1 MAG: SpoVR family protein [Campylobacterota bacterium]